MLRLVNEEKMRQDDR